ncbi:MAG: BatD family protein [Balneola sp.]
MIKIGNKPVLLFVLLISGIANQLLLAQDVSVQATLTETNIFEGESVQLDIAISGTSLNSLERPEIPSISGLRYLPNRTISGSNYTYVNGKPSLTQSYGFQFIAQSPGSYTVPSIKVTVNGKEFATKPIAFKVLDPKTIDNGNAERAPDIYVRLEPTTQNPVVGQQVVADIVLYFKSEVEVSNYNTVPGWKAEGFWKEELNNPTQARTTSVIINGIRYKRARLLQYALFPTKAGELTLSPYSLTVRVRNSRRTARDPFNFSFGQENKELKTLPVTLDVGRPPAIENAEYIGAVGDFEIKRTIKPSSAYVGESVEIVTEITGSGNLPLLNKPEYDFPESLELYNPQENTSITRDNRLIAGSKTFTDIIIARNDGTYSIPEKRIATFNPDKNSYEYFTLSEIKFRADIDPNATVTSLEDMRLDIEPVTGLAQWRQKTGIPLTERNSIWVMLFTPFLLFIGAYGYKNYYDKLNNDAGFARSTKAKDKAMDILDNAKTTEDIKEGYHKIQKALSQFIADKLNLPIAGVSGQSLITEIQKKGADKSVITEAKRVFDKCETIAYAPNISQEGLEDDVEKTKQLIKDLGKVL